MTQRESRLSKDIRKAIEQVFRGDVFLFKVWGNEFQMSGLPDLLGCLKGDFFGIEVKLPEYKDKVSPRQTYVHKLIRAAGGQVAICCTRQEAIHFLERMAKGISDCDAIASKG